MITELRQALEQVARRFRSVRLWGGLARCWLAWALIGGGLIAYLSRAGAGPIPVGWLLTATAFIALISAVVIATRAIRSARDDRWVARRVEARYPELGTGLLAAIEGDPKSPQYGFL